MLERRNVVNNLLFKRHCNSGDWSHARQLSVSLQVSVIVTSPATQAMS